MDANLSALQTMDLELKNVTYLEHFILNVTFVLAEGGFAMFL